jgi:hypothetical protein
VYGTNITIFDKWGTHPSSGPGEDGEVEPPDLNTQAWDIEGFFLQGNTLTLIGGYNFKNGEPDSSRPGNVITSGDIFIGTNVNNVKFGSDITTSYSSYQVVDNTFGYDYVIRLNFGSTNTYSVYRIDSSDKVIAPYFNVNSKSSPWRYDSGGTLISGGNMVYQTGLTNTLLNPIGPNHNAVSVDLGFLGYDKDFIAHFTMGCGNDMVVGEGTTVPEPGTLILLGSGLIAAIALGRKIKIRK